MKGVELTPEILARLDADAQRIVGSLLAEATVEAELSELLPPDGTEFQDMLLDRELAMIADGMEPSRTYLRLSVVIAAWDAVHALVEIRSLPVTTAWAASGRRCADEHQTV